MGIHVTNIGTVIERIEQAGIFEIVYMGTTYHYTAANKVL